MSQESFAEHLKHCANCQRLSETKFPIPEDVLPGGVEISVIQAYGAMRRYQHVTNTFVNQVAALGLVHVDEEIKVWTMVSALGAELGIPMEETEVIMIETHKLDGLAKVLINLYERLERERVAGLS